MSFGVVLVYQLSGLSRNSKNVFVKPGISPLAIFANLKNCEVPAPLKLDGERSQLSIIETALSPIFFNSISYSLIILIRIVRSEEHTSELQSRPHLVCRLLLEKKKPLQRRY